MRFRLKAGETPTWGPFESMWRAELVVHKEWLEGNVSKGYICQWLSLFAAPVLVAKKPDGGLKFCIEYRDIWRKTVNIQRPLTLIREMLNHIWEALIYMPYNVGWACNLLRVKGGNEHKLAFWTRQNLFAHTVIVLDLTHAATPGKASVQQKRRYNYPATAVLLLITIDYACLLYTLAIREVLWECYASVTMCNIELQNEANFSYCMHSINPLFSIVISTTITITTTTITTIAW